MKMKKSIAMLLASTMALSTLAACGSENTTANSSSSSSSSSSSGTSSAGTTLHSTERNTTGENLVTFPLESALTVDFHYHARNKYVFKSDWPVFQEMTKITNMSFNNTGNEVGTNSDTEISLEASKKYPSAVYGGNNTAISYFMEDGPNGAFYALDDYWDYLPNFSAYLDENPDVAATIMAGDGKIYHIPYIAEGGVARTYHIRQDWLDNLGLDMPETVEQLEEVLIAFRDDDPNGNGLNDEIPYFNDKWNEMIRLVNLWDARCYATDTYAERVVVGFDNELYHAWMADEFLTAIENVSRWYDIGLIDQEVFTQENSARPTYLPGDTGGMTHEWVASTSAYNDVVNIEGFNFVTMAPPITASGNQWEEHARIKVKPDGWAISKQLGQSDKSKVLSEEEVGIVFAYMDYFWGEEGRILSNWGVEGQHWEYVDGEPTFLPGVLDGSLTGNKAVNSFLEEDVGAQLKHGYWQDYTYEWQWTNEIGQAGVELYTDSNGEGVFSVPILPQLNFNASEKKIYETYVSDINDYLDAKVQSWVVGDWTKIAGQWDAHIAEMEAMGVETLMGAYNSAYTRYLSNLS